MKKKIGSICILLAFLGSCKKDNNPVDQYHYGEGNALLNGKVWKAKANANTTPSMPNKVNIEFDVYNSLNELREATGVGNLELKVGTDIIVNDTTDSTNVLLNIKPISAYYRMTDDGDVLSDIYRVAENKPNIISITKYNPSTKEIEGEFTATFYRDTSFSHLPQDTIYFTQGTFWTKILN